MENSKDTYQYNNVIFKSSEKTAGGKPIFNCFGLEGGKGFWGHVKWSKKFETYIYCSAPYMMTHLRIGVLRDIIDFIDNRNEEN